MENEDLARALEHELHDIVLEVQITAKRTLHRIFQLKNRSMEEAEIEFLETTTEKLREFINDSNYVELIKFLQNEELVKKTSKSVMDRIEKSEGLKVTLENTESEHVEINQTLDEYEKNSPKFNVPLDYNDHLELYLERLREFMRFTWKEQAEVNREKNQRSLVECMQQMDQSDGPFGTIFDSLMAYLIDVGIQISKSLTEYVMLVMPVVYKREQISTTLDKVGTILRCLSVEENSIVINTFVSVVQSFDKTIKKAAILYEEKGLKEGNVWLANEIECSLLRLIITEALRLEVDYCYPHMMIHNDQVFYATIFLKKKVFKDKLGAVKAKISELKKEMQSIQDEGSSMKGFLHQALDVGAKEEWYKVGSLLRKNKHEIINQELVMSKFEFEYLYRTLDEYEKKFKKCNVPERFSEPLKQYVARLREFMKLNWKEPIEKNREKEWKSLIEWMLKLDQSKVQNKITFDTLKSVLIDLGTEISMSLIEYFILLMAIFEKQEILSTLHEVKTILRCLSLEQNSIVIKTFVSVLQSFEKILPARTILDDAKGKGKMKKETCKEINFWLNNETKNSLLHLIIIEVFRLEVCFCCPRMPTSMVLHIVPMVMATYLKDNVFKDKLTKINELKKEKLSILDEASSVKGLLQRALDLRDGIHEEWYKVLKPKRRGSK